jgi:hypothetical protein
MLAMPNLVCGLCLPVLDPVIEVKIFSCHPTTLRSDQPLGWPVKLTDQVAGALIRAHVVESSSPPERPPEGSGRLSHRMYLKKDDQVLLFVRGEVSSICRGYKDRDSRTFKFQTADLCCDTGPKRGLCMVPSPVIVVVPW